MKFGLIGHPIEHSLSPALFKAGYNGRYTYDLIIEEDFNKAYQIFLNEYDGINVTAPFKEAALHRADIIAEECRLAGAANILVKTPEGIKAYNSDFRGLVQILKGLDLQKDENIRTLITGLGGAGKAAVAAARASGHETILMNRTIYHDDIRPLNEFTDRFREADIIIYNIPVEIEEISLLKAEDFSPGRKKIVIEANYRNPSFSNSLIQKIKKINPLFEYIDGRKWLLMQAVTGYEIFTGESPDSIGMSASL